MAYITASELVKNNASFAVRSIIRAAIAGRRENDLVRAIETARL
jgi:hypothetical protein